MINEIIPEGYVAEKFYQYAGYPKYKKLTNVYEAGCPICREGKSWGKKRRLYYVVKDNYIFCGQSENMYLSRLINKEKLVNVTPGINLIDPRINAHRFMPTYGICNIHDLEILNLN